MQDFFCRKSRIFVDAGGYGGNGGGKVLYHSAEKVLYHRGHRGTQGKPTLPVFLCDPCGEDFDLFITNQDTRPSQTGPSVAAIDGCKEKRMASPVLVPTRIHQVSGVAVNAAMRVH